MTRSTSLIPFLRRELKLRGWTNGKLAKHFQVGEATSKRWLSGKGLSFERFDQLVDLCGLTLIELARQAEHSPATLAQELTLAQERALSEDEFLSFLFIVILGGYDWHETVADFAVPESQIEGLLLRLERLALIDRLPGGRVRPLIDRAIYWRKSPMRTQFERRMKPQFLQMDFAADDAVYASDVIKLSAQGAAMLAELIEKHRREIQALAQQDRQHSLLPQSWHATLSALRPLDMSGLQT